MTYAEIEANEGHDAFLMPIPRYMEAFQAYMQRVGEQLMRLDLTHIQRWIAPARGYLTWAAADGEFLQNSADQRQVRGTGLEIDQADITSAIARG